jgi:excisionase family DNA binding protein
MKPADHPVSPTMRVEDLPEYLSPEEFRAYMRIGRNAVYELLRQHEIPHVRLGRLIRIPKTALQQLRQSK